MKIEILPELDNSIARIIEKEKSLEDGFQNSLRPKVISEYVGQEKVVNNLSIAISAAKTRGEPLDHVLLYGPPGLGKTTLAALIASERGSALKTTSGPVIERPGDLAAIVSGLQANDVLFIDEVHRLSRVAEEILYSAMEDFTIDIVVGEGPSARSVKLNLQPFTLIGATTRVGMLSSPLRDRFGLVERVDFYKVSELVEIVKRSARLLGVEIDHAGAEQIAKRSRGTPRIANRLLKRARDYAQERTNSGIDAEVANTALTLLEVDAEGFDKMDRSLMLTIIDKFAGGPVGLETLAASISEDKDTIEDVYEPYLIQKGFLKRTPRGREATEIAYRYFNRNLPAQDQRELF